MWHRFYSEPKPTLPDSLRGELLEEYIDALRKYTPVDRDYFYAQLRHFVLFRTLQVLGAYGFRATSRRSPTSSRAFRLPSPISGIFLPTPIRSIPTSARCSKSLLA